MWATTFKKSEWQTNRIFFPKHWPSGPMLSISRNVRMFITKVAEYILCHLCFKQAQPKMCHSPKVDDGVDIFFKTS